MIPKDDRLDNPTTYDDYIVTDDYIITSKDLPGGNIEMSITPKDMVNNPDHYNQSSIECIDAIEASMPTVEFQGYLKGNALKYKWRYRYKGSPIEDLKKSQWYTAKLIKSLEDDLDDQ